MLGKYCLLFSFFIPHLCEAITRPPAVAGRWYSADKNSLKKEIKSFLKNVNLPPLPEKINALIVPHAGYTFSGQTAAYAYKAIAGKRYKRVVIFAPSHYARFYGASTFDVEAYETPLGKVFVDRKIVKALLKEPIFNEYVVAHLREHAIEAQLPFLQMVLKEFKLIPVLIGNINKKDLKEMAKIIKKVFNDKIKDTLFIASSDFTHFGPAYGYVPFKEKVPENIKKLDMDAIKFILKIDPEGFLNYVKEKKATICGIYPIALTLWLLPEKAKGYLLHYTTSGKIIGDYTNSVSYAAIVLDKFSLTKEEKKALLKLARFTLTYYFEHNKLPDLSEIPIKLTPALKEKKGAFVTLKKHGKLRGCIGFIMPLFPLYETVMQASLRAAFNDPRFFPLDKSELSQIKIEISVLGPIIPVKKTEEIKIGRDGLIVKMGNYQGLLLPQVATELNLNRIQFLELTCRKAGLPPWAWKDKDTLIYRFSAEVFGEN